VRFDLLMLLGGLNEDLDLLDAAAKSIDDAVAVALRQYGEHDLRYAQALEAKAEILVRKGAYAEALKVADQALLAAGPLRPDNTALFAKTHILVGNVHNQLEPLNSPAARSHLETAYTALKATAAISDDRSRVCFYLARIWEGAGDYTKAETYYLEGIKTAETNFGPRSYIAAFGYDNFGDMLRHVHRYAESEKYVRAGLATYQTLYGPKHVNVAMSASNLALILQEQGKRAAAESMYANAVALITASRGADNILMIQLQFLQARMLLADGALQRSKAVYDAMLQTKTLYDPSNGVALLATKIDLARLQILRGDLVDAQRLVTEVAAAYAGTPDARSKRGLRLMLRQGEILTARRDAAAAAGQFKHAVELQFELGSNADELLSDTLFSASYGPLAPAVARDLLTRVNAHAGVKALRAGAKPGVDELEQLHTALGRIELAAGDLSAAQADLGAALQLRRAHDDSNSPWLAVTQRMLAEYYLARHDLPAARAALREAEKIMAANGIRSDYLQAPLQSLLARVD
jgi:tetratricopeptide (TPR) repeat protein